MKISSLLKSITIFLTLIFVNNNCAFSKIQNTPKQNIERCEQDIIGRYEMLGQPIEKLIDIQEISRELSDNDGWGKEMFKPTKSFNEAMKNLNDITDLIWADIDYAQDQLDNYIKYLTDSGEISQLDQLALGMIQEEFTFSLEQIELFAEFVKNYIHISNNILEFPFKIVTNGEMLSEMYLLRDFYNEYRTSVTATNTRALISRIAQLENSPTKMLESIEEEFKLLPSRQQLVRAIIGINNPNLFELDTKAYDIALQDIEEIGTRFLGEKSLGVSQYGTLLMIHKKEAPTKEIINIFPKGLESSKFVSKFNLLRDEIKKLPEPEAKIFIDAMKNKFGGVSAIALLVALEGVTNHYENIKTLEAAEKRREFLFKMKDGNINVEELPNILEFYADKDNHTGILQDTQLSKNILPLSIISSFMDWKLADIQQAIANENKYKSDMYNTVHKNVSATIDNLNKKL